MLIMIENLDLIRLEVVDPDPSPNPEPEPQPEPEEPQTEPTSKKKLNISSIFLPSQNYISL